VNVKELVKSNTLIKITFKKQVIFLSLAFLFLGCEDNSYLKTIYDNKKINNKISCMKLKLSPYSNEVYNKINSLYNFSEVCENTLKITYKTNIACNSKFNKSKSFNSYIQLELLNNNQRVYSIYKDLKDANISNEIQKGYNQLCKKIKI